MPSSYLYALICVVALAAGQVLFKAAAIASKEVGSFVGIKPATLLIAAMGIYAGASLLWVWVLRSEELGRIYPVMALAFVLVPLASNLFFGERFQTTYWIGVFLVIAGLILAAKS